MVETYELYLLRPNQPRAFVPLTCRQSEVVFRAKEELDRTDAIACDVEQFGRVILRLEKSRQEPMSG